MTVKEQLVAVVKCNGKILREDNGVVSLPFGSEYSLLLKNLNSRRASLKISIDGQDVLDQSSLVIESNQETELQGFLTGMIAKNKFKFIQKTKEIQDHRGDKIDDGIIRIEFAFEKPPVIKREVIIEHHHHWNRWPYYPCYGHYDYEYRPIRSFYNSNEVIGSTAEYTTKGSSSGQQVNENNDIQVYNCSLNNLSTPQQDEGITVKGNEIAQAFHSTFLGELEPAEVITIRLKGYKQDGEPVKEAKTVKTKVTCPTCGRRCRSSMKYCSNCGTFLE
jgi:hypothetical protein